MTGLKLASLILPPQFQSISHGRSHQPTQNHSLDDKMADHNVLDSDIEQSPTILGFTPINGPSALRRSLSKANEQPAAKRRKKSERSISNTSSGESKPRRKTSILTGKITKPKGNNGSSSDIRTAKPEQWRSLQKSKAHAQAITKQLPKTTLDRLASFRYTGPNAGDNQGLPSRSVCQSIQLSSDEIEEAPPSHQPELQSQTRHSNALNNRASLTPEQDLDAFLLNDTGTENLKQPGSDPQFEPTFVNAAGFCSSPSGSTIPTQILPYSPKMHNDELNEGKEKGSNHFSELDNDEEETVALVELAENISPSKPAAQPSAFPSPPKILVPSTQTTIPECSPIFPSKTSIYFQPALSNKPVSVSNTTPPSISVHNFAHQPHLNPIAAPTLADGPCSPSNPSVRIPSAAVSTDQTSLTSASAIEAGTLQNSAIIHPPAAPPKPFMRGKHPRLLNHRSPIPGLSTTPRILTCFRLGEAINATSQSLRAGHPVQVELYARVLSSLRVGEEQHFRFADLWYNSSKGGLVVEGKWTGWKGLEVWEGDGNVFLDCNRSGKDEEGIMCRVVGRLERKAEGGWRLEVNTCWEVGWEDVENVRSIVCS